jgi:hypothetical protein
MKNEKNLLVSVIPNAAKLVPNAPESRRLHPAYTMSHAIKNKGGQKAWTTDEQKAWLTTKIPDFQSARGSSKQSEFWALLFENWFTKWPLVEQGPGEGSASLSDEDMDPLKKHKVS